MKTKISLKEYFENVFKDYFYGWKTYEIIWGIVAVFAVTAAIIIGWDSSDIKMSIIYAIASFTNTVCVVLVTKQRLSSYFWGIIGVISLGIACLYSQLPVNAAVNLLYFLPLQFIGFWQWFKKQKRVDIVTVRWGKWFEVCAYMGSIVLITAIIYVFLPIIGAGIPVEFMSGSKVIQLLDAAGGAGNMIAQLLMNAALIEQWIVWFGIDITQSIVFFKLMIANGGGYYISMAVMYCVWLLNAAFGLASWISDKRKQ